MHVWESNYESSTKRDSARVCLPDRSQNFGPHLCFNITMYDSESVNVFQGSADLIRARLRS